MDENLHKLKETGCEVSEQTCEGVYDTIIKVKYGCGAHDVGWIYLKDHKILLIHIKDDEFPDLDSFIGKLKELKK